MHEYHAVDALIERITSGSGVPGRVTEVRVRAGVVFSPEALQQAWEMRTRATPLERSRLVVEERSDAQECPVCGTRWGITSDDVAGHLLICPFCGAPSPIEGGTGIDVLGWVIRPARAEAGDSGDGAPDGYGSSVDRRGV